MQSNQRVTISRGNRKLGAILNVSTEPVRCCPKGIPCAEGGCYALRSIRLYPPDPQSLGEERPHRQDQSQELLRADR